MRASLQAAQLRVVSAEDMSVKQGGFRKNGWDVTCCQTSAVVKSCGICLPQDQVQPVWSSAPVFTSQRLTNPLEVGLYLPLRQVCCACAVCCGEYARSRAGKDQILRRDSNGRSCT